MFEKLESNSPEPADEPSESVERQPEGHHKSKFSVLLTDDHALFRQSLANLLSGEPDIEVVAQASNASEAVEKASMLKPDLVLMDVDMPGLSSFEAVRQIKRNVPGTKMLLVTMHDDEDYLMQGLQAGAIGYVLKDSPVVQLLQALRDAVTGGSFLSPRMLSHLVDDLRERPKSRGQQNSSSNLTPREHEVLKALAEGKSVKEIAGDWNLSVKTIEAHKFNLMRKLNIRNKAQLVLYAVQTKVIKVR